MPLPSVRVCQDRTSAWSASHCTQPRSTFESMYLRVAQAAALTFNIAGTLAPLAAAVLYWADNQALAWVSFGVLAVIVLFVINNALLGIAGILIGVGLLVYALTEDISSALLATLAAAGLYYLIAWQVHRAKVLAAR